MASDFNLDQFPLPKDWTRQELIDCTEDGNISYGIVQPGKHLDEGIPVLRVNNIGNNSLDLEAVMKVDPKIEKKYLRTRLLGGEVLLTLVGSTGQSIIAPEYMKGWNVARAIAVIRADKNIGADWINICLQSRETHHYLNSRANTTVQKTLNLKDVRSIPIPIPPLKTKLFIENIATSLSKKIELNRQMNETLEAMAQALFKSWFVDFDPVIDNALAAGNAIPDEFAERAEQRKGIEKKDNSDIQNLFPDEFEFSEEMGWIPKGWAVKRIKDIGKVVTGKTPPKKIDNAYSENGIPFITPTDIDDLPFVIYTNRYLSEDGVQAVKNSRISAGSICVTCIGSQMGKTTIAPLASVSNQQINSITGCNQFWRNYLFFNLRRRRDEIFLLGSSGSTMPILNKSNFEAFPVLCPSEKLLSSLDSNFQSTIDSILENTKQSYTLAKLRDTLLPKLMSGELHIAYCRR